MSFSLKQNLLSPNAKPEVKQAEIKAETVEEKTEKRNDKFTQEQLDDAFKEYLNSMKSLQPRMYSALLKRNAILSENNKVEITFDTELQHEIFSRENKGKAQAYLREKLSNDYIVIEVKVLEDDSTEKKPIYTSEDKFKYLSEKNPALINLRKRFKMDLD